jgi:hypothetical protein
LPPKRNSRVTGRRKDRRRTRGMTTRSGWSSQITVSARSHS